MKRSILRFVILLLSSSAPLFGAEPLVVDEGEVELSVGPYVEFLEDADGRYRIEDLVSERRELPFVQSNSKHLNFSYSDSVYWIRFKLNNVTERTRTLLLENAFASMDYISLYKPLVDGSYQKITYGDRTPFARRLVPSRLPTFKLDIPPGESEYYLRAHSSGVVTLDLKLWSIWRFQAYQIVNYSVLFVLFGCLFAMCIYNFFIFLTFRNTAYLLYVAYILSFMAFQVSMSGISLQFLTHNSSVNWLSNIGNGVTGVLSGIFGALFAIKFLELRTTQRWSFFILCGLLVSLGINLVGFFVFEFGPMGKLAGMQTLLVSIAAISAGVVGVIRGYRPAYFYTFAWAFLITAFGLHGRDNKS
jgi:hypothetical protein